MWKMEERLMYRKIMLFHNIVHSDDSRLAKKIIEEQEKNDEKGTWYADVCRQLKMLEIDPEMIKESLKSTLKKKVKEQIRKRMARTIKTFQRTSTKMRFINCGEFEIKDYITNGCGFDALKTLKTRLNMHEIYGNYKGNYELSRLCPHCQTEDDTTEHLLMCAALGPSTFIEKDLENDNNIELWRQINERVTANMDWR
jgi:hypothetical protein